MSRIITVFAIGLVTAVQACASEPAATSESSAIALNTITRESLDRVGRQGNGDSTAPSISGNQRFVAFQSGATVWAPTVDTNDFSDIYLKDRNNGVITLITQRQGVVGNGESTNPSVSDDGKVAFVSNATNLAPGTTARNYILVRNPDGTFVQVDTALAGAPDGTSAAPVISGDGRFVAFASTATNLVAGDTNGVADVFVRDLTTGAIARVSVGPGGEQGDGASREPSISFDGHAIAFTTDADNFSFRDVNGASDVFVRDQQLTTTLSVSFTTTGVGGAFGNGASAQPQISGDGKHVSFRSLATNFDFDDLPDTNNTADIFVKDLFVGVANTPHRVSLSTAGAEADGPSFQSAIGFTGTFVAFVSDAGNLVANDTNGVADVFVRDRTLNQTIRIQPVGADPDGPALVDSSLQLSGDPANPSPSFLVFASTAFNLVAGDTNHFADVFSASLSP